MPTYEYRCPGGHQFEVFQRISDPPGAPCPECGGPGERQISAGAGFLFKGDGFYITDYRSSDYKKKASADAPSTSAGSGGDGAGASSPTSTSSSSSGSPSPSSSSEG